MIDALCEQHKAKGRLVKATQMVGRTPMCNECFLEAKRAPAAEVQTAAIPSALASLNAVEDEARAAGQWRRRTPHGDAAPRPRRRTLSEIADAAVSRQKKDKEEPMRGPGPKADYEAMQADRNRGMSVAELVEKYRVDRSSVYNHTRAPAADNGAGAAHRGNAKPRAQVAKTSPRTGGQYEQVLAELVAKRDRLNQVIEGLQELAGA